MEGMELRDIKLMARQGEGPQVEFKKRINHPDKVVREVVAFANTDGGTILVGVDDNGDLSGLKYAEEDDYLMQKAIAELSKPRVVYESGTVKLDDQRNLLYYFIPPSTRKPHYALETSGQRWGKAYIRKGDKSIQASHEVLELIRKNRTDQPHGFSYGDEERALLKYLEAHGTVTLKQFVAHAGIKPSRASKVLVALTLAGVLAITPDEEGDQYVFKADTISASKR